MVVEEDEGRARARFVRWNLAPMSTTFAMLVIGPGGRHDALGEFDSRGRTREGRVLLRKKPE
jgi:hypothetical protein